MKLSLIYLALYFGCILLVARLFSRKISDLKDYFLAGRSLGAWPIALAFAASWFGAASTMGSINAFHDQGLSGAWLLVIPSILSFVAIAVFMARRVAAQPYLSQPEAVAVHYGRLGRLLLAITILMSVTTLVGSQLVAAGKVFQGVFGLDLTLATLACTALVVTYAMWGGFFTVVVTDMAQMFFVITGFLLLLLFTAGPVIADPATLQSWLHARPAAFWQWDRHWQENLYLVFTFVIAWSIAPEMWQRMSATRNPDVAAKAARRAGILMTGLFAVITLIGLFSTHTVGKSDAVLVALALKLPHEALGAFVIIGFIGAIASTMDSSMNVGSLTLTHDIYQSFLRPGAGNRELVWVSRLATVLVVMPAVAIALYYQDFIRVLWISADIYACTMFFPIVGILYLRQPGRLSGVLAMIAGGLCVLLSMLIQNGLMPEAPLALAGLAVKWPGWPYSTLLGVSASGIAFAAGYALEKAFPALANLRPVSTGPAA